ncbi:hypothetical protein LBMAG33_1470 [Candidatus Levyibacteriota bacterium]|nr:hypothetical protein LBMAG33_1470 [Candidatus Levybacteria bacterium]
MNIMVTMAKAEKNKIFPRLDGSLIKYKEANAVMGNKKLMRISNGLFKNINE